MIPTTYNRPARAEGWIASATLGSAVYCDVRGIDFVSVSTTCLDGTFAGTYQVQTSHDGVVWAVAAYFDPTTGGETAVANITAAGMKRHIPMGDAPMLRVVCTTASGTVAIYCTIYAEGLPFVDPQGSARGGRMGMGGNIVGGSMGPGGAGEGTSSPGEAGGPASGGGGGPSSP